MKHRSFINHSTVTSIDIINDSSMIFLNSRLGEYFLKAMLEESKSFVSGVFVPIELLKCYWCRREISSGCCARGPMFVLCGQGSKTTEKDCVTYFIARDGTCQELRSKDSARCGGEQLSITEKCIERTCG